jgi:hypothetical protein
MTCETDPPFSPADLRRSTADIIAAGDKWRNIPDDFLVGVIGRHESTGAGYILNGASAELTRRGVDAQRALQSAVAASIAVQNELVSAVRAASDSSDNFAAQAQVLNRSIRWFTIAMFFVGLVQIAVALYKGGA